MIDAKETAGAVADTLGRRSGQRGLLVVYTGHGKGKTTAALGMVFSALGLVF